MFVIMWLNCHVQKLFSKGWQKKVNLSILPSAERMVYSVKSAWTFTTSESGALREKLTCTINSTMQSGRCTRWNAFFQHESPVYLMKYSSSTRESPVYSMKSSPSLWVNLVFSESVKILPSARMSPVYSVKILPSTGESPMYSVKMERVPRCTRWKSYLRQERVRCTRWKSYLQQERVRCTRWNALLHFLIDHGRH